jgi:hypothetical protein
MLKVLARILRENLLSSESNVIKEMLKVGIITIQKSSNYGACLQCYALYKYIESLGYDCEIIDLHRPGVKHQEYRSSKRFSPSRYSIKKSIIERLKKWCGKDIEQKYPRSAIRMDKIHDFNNRLKYSRPYEGPDDLYANPPEYDIYISGSDQLWNPTMNYCLEPYFLTFAPKGSKKISFATSIGVSNLLEREKQSYREWLSDYTAISVREKTAQTLLASFVDNHVEQVLDPSFLLSKDEWLDISIPPKISKPYILLFTLEYSENLLEYAKELKEESDLELVYLCWRQPTDSFGNYIVEREAGIEEFLGYIRGASLVITNSFHGTAFSLILETNNFIVYVGKSKRSSRIVDMLAKFSLSDHIIEKLEQPFKVLSVEPIDYHAIHDLKQDEIKRSRDFVKASLLRCNH